MTPSSQYSVVLFKSVSHAMKAERILKEKKIPIKLIPVPKSISSDCGVCIRFVPELQSEIEAALAGEVEVSEIRTLQ